MNVITLHAEDDIISICDRLDWSGAAQALLVLPPQGDALLDGLDLVRLRRHADRRRLEIGLITPQKKLARQARALGIPAFATVREAQRGRRGWWRGKRRSEQVGLPTLGGQLTIPPRPFPAPDYQKEEPIPAAMPRQWLLRYAAILLFFVAAALVIVAFLYFVPVATITLHPRTQPLRVEQRVLVDPALQRMDAAAFTLPGRTVTAVVAWQSELATTGAVETAGAAARGLALFTNESDAEIVLPAGTRVGASTNDELLYQTTTAVTLPGVFGATAEVEVVAVSPGPQGNAAAGVLDQLPDRPDAPLAVRNLEAISGGDVRRETAVSQADQERLRAQVIQFLQALAASELSAQLVEGEFLTRESVRVVRILSETYSHPVGAPTSRLSLAMEAELAATAVDSAAASGLAYEGLAAQAPSGFTLLPDAIRIDSGDVVSADDAGRVTVVMIAEAEAAADLPLTPLLPTIAGQETAVAAAYLFENLPLRAAPAIDVWPVWFNRVPYVPSRIRTEVVP